MIQNNNININKEKMHKEKDQEKINKEEKEDKQNMHIPNQVNRN